MFKKTASCQGNDVSDLPHPSAGFQTGNKATERPTLASLWPAAAVALLGLPVLVLLALTLGEGRGQYVVIAAPWTDRAGVADGIHRAGAGLVASGFLPNIAVAWSEEGDFPAAARAQGAWLVLPTAGFAGCGSASGGRGR